MSEPIPYQYFVLRAVPRPEREEFVNVGVVLYAEALDELAMGWQLDADRVRALDPGADVDALRDALAHLERMSRTGGAAGMARARRRGALFGWLAAPRSTLVQPGPVHGGLWRSAAKDPDTRDGSPLAPIVEQLLDRCVRLPSAS